MAAAKGLLKFGINAAGDIVGYYRVGSGPRHACLLGTFTSFDFPGMTDTRALGISSAPLCDPGTVENLRLRFVIRDHGRALEVIGSGAVVVSGTATRDLDANECP